MAIDLKKGGRINLNKESSHPLRRVRLGLGWKPNPYDGPAYDLDATAFACKSAGNGLALVSDQHMIFYGNKTTPSGSITHSGDNRTGDGDGDDETIIVDLDKLKASDAQVEEITLVVTINDAEKNGQNFGQVRNSYVKAYNDETGEEIANFSLEDSATENTAVHFGSIVRRGDEFVFLAVGDGFKKGLADFVRLYGAEVA